jgi:hypothetical protein
MEERELKQRNVEAALNRRIATYGAGLREVKWKEGFHKPGSLQRR